MKRGYPFTPSLAEIIVLLVIVLIFGSIVFGTIFKGCGYSSTSSSGEIEEKGVSADRVIVLEQKVDDLERRLEKLEKK